ncbi:hypothetical protein KACC15558_20810 [Brevibacterium ammoniilyticum]|uniref:Uncharacterized protein n=1 Tax=Brevibacterium ammoniilyticum TaxID=1046555 RepID=A0ABP9U5W9_9MICO
MKADAVRAGVAATGMILARDGAAGLTLVRPTAAGRMLACFTEVGGLSGPTGHASAAEGHRQLARERSSSRAARRGNTRIALPE